MKAMPQEVASLYQSEFNQAIRDGHFQPRGVEVTDASSKSGPHKDIPPFYFREPRTFSPQRNQIEPQHDSQTMDQWVTARAGGGRSPSWHDVWFPKNAFSRWLLLWVRRQLTRDAAEGMIQREAVDKHLAALAERLGVESPHSHRSTVTPRRAGPKPKVDPERFEAECHKYIEDEGVPDPKLDPQFRQADVERHMMDWHNGAISASRNRVLVVRAIESFIARFQGR